jgi:nascent polypeptide-associated complex subunit alpha
VYIVFGEAKLEDLGAQAQASAAEQFKQPEALPADDTEEAPELVGEDDSAEADGLQEKDIELVMQQANCSRAKAIKALKNHDSDIVNAIMELTT